MRSWVPSLVLSWSLACGADPEPSAPPAPPVEAPPPDAPPPEPPHDNLWACRRYVEAVNAAPCTATLRLDASALCTEQVRTNPCDLVAYFGCLADATRCDGAVPDLSAQRACAVPACPHAP